MSKRPTLPVPGLHDVSNLSLLTPLQFGTKSETLARMEGRLVHARVLPQICATVKQWRETAPQIIEAVKLRGWLKIPLIVRSSAQSEDSSSESLAGKYVSVPNVMGEQGLQAAFETVIASFDAQHDADQVFIQPMLTGVKLSGVAFTREPTTGGAHYVINYDDHSGSTTSVTSGATNKVRTYYYFKGSQIAPQPALAPLLQALHELGVLFAHDRLDVEFALSNQNELYILQVRPLVLRSEPRLDEHTHAEVLRLIQKRVAEVSKPHPYLYGDRSVFGVMPDWNPAEIIGIRPRPLALSLYKELVTDSIWAYQRDNYGYKNLRSFPLLLSFFGLPYIDVRVSFNSFIPADVSPELSNKLANHYINRLLTYPNYHDKVEFEIIYSCYTLDLPQRLEALRAHDFAEQDIASFAESLRVLTNNIISGENGLWRKDAERIKELEARLDAIRSSELDASSKIYWLIEDCKRYGTLPFAGLARAGFIAVQLLKSLVSVGILSHREYDCFMNSLDTISSCMGKDFARLSRSAFLAQYGHLRPGTYDLLSPRYDEAPERYFDWEHTPPPPDADRRKQDFALSLGQIRAIEDLLKQHRLEHDVLGLFDFIKGAIEGREYSKFVFTKSLSEVLSLFGQLAEEHGYAKERASYADISIIRKLYGSSDDVAFTLGQSIAEGEAAYAVTTNLTLPPLITCPDDVMAFELPQCEPNFVTLNKALGPALQLPAPHEQLHGAILFIPSADPGYDWIFSHGIAGFVTMYGGANSHMAIRAGELGIPAVIGAGETLFNKWASGKMLDMDCANRLVRILR